MNESSNSSPTLVELLGQAKDGNSQALETLLERYRPFLRLLAARLLNKRMAVRQDGSDMVQETLMDVATAIGEFRGETEPEFSAWIKQILRNNILNGVRHNHAKVRDIDKEVSPMIAANSATLSWHPTAGGDSPSHRLLHGEDALRLAEAMDKLPDEQREAVALRYLEGLKLVEIAEEMKRTDKSVAGLVHRGLQALRAAYDGDSRMLVKDLKPRNKP